MSHDPTRRQFLAAAAGPDVRVWDMSSVAQGVSEPCFILRGHTGSVLALAFGPNGKLLVSAGQDGAVKVWDTTGGSVIRPLVGHTSAVHGVAFSPEGRRVVSAGADTTVRVWEALSGKLLSTFRGHHQPVSCVFPVSVASKRTSSNGTPSPAGVFETMCDGWKISCHCPCQKSNPMAK